MSKRVLYWSPFKLTRPWSVRWMKGADENCNQSLVLQLPFIGAVVLFYERGPLRTEPCDACKVINS